MIGFGVVICEGWPSMGADLGGVIALTPALLWLLLVLADIPITWPKLVVAAGSALLLVAAISWLDWLRGPTGRTHLGGFFQRVLDGDASNHHPQGSRCRWLHAQPGGDGPVLVGVVVWVFLFRRLLPALRTEFTTLHMVAVAALGVAILGTAVNDGGITVWYTITLAFTLTVSALWVGHASPQCDSLGCTARRFRRPAQCVVTRAARSFRPEPSDRQIGQREGVPQALGRARYVVELDALD
jgi:hypothetical protein